MNWDHFNLEFTLNNEGIQFWADGSEDKVLYCSFEEGKLDIAVKYDFSEKPPLHLSAAAKCGDRIRVHFLPYRLELYVNDILSDEEWPAGDHYLSTYPIKDNGCSLSVYESKISKKCEPAVLDEFQNAEGWQPEANVFVGDCMPYSHNGIYHVLYLKDRHRHRSKWGKGAHQWSHISTEDFINWKIHPMAVEIDDPAEGSICTGSWIYNGAKHYLFYTVRMCDGSPAQICRSVSNDGYHFEKDKSFNFTLSEKYTAQSARDPKIIKDASGLFHMILTTSLCDSKLGCLAHLISSDLDQWKELDEPLYIASEDMGEPECPDYFYKDGFYYLVYSLLGKGYYLYSQMPFTGWQLPNDPIIPCKSVPKAAIWNDRLIFTGFDGKGKYAGTMTFLEAVVKENGLLAIKELV